MEARHAVPTGYLASLCCSELLQRVIFDIVLLLLAKELSLHLLLADDRLSEPTELHLDTSSASRQCVLVLLSQCHFSRHDAQKSRDRDSVPLALHHSATYGQSRVTGLPWDSCFVRYRSA